MKYYIILQPSIRSMGGEEMYTRNKVVSARETWFCTNSNPQWDRRKDIYRRFKNI